MSNDQVVQPMAAEAVLDNTLVNFREVNTSTTSEKNESVTKDVSAPSACITIDMLDSYLYGKNTVLALHSKQAQQEERTAPGGKCHNEMNHGLNRNDNSGPCAEQLKTKNDDNTSHAPEHFLPKPSDVMSSTYAVTSFPGEVQLCMSSIPGTKFGVCANKKLPAGTWIGPYEGRRTSDQRQINIKESNEYLWEIYREGKVSHFIDGSDENSSSWMRFIRCARSRKEQNMGAYQYGQNIYYKTFREIAVGDELLVWYSDCYGKHLDIPVSLQEPSLGTLEAKEMWDCTTSAEMIPNSSHQSHNYSENHTSLPSSSPSSRHFTVMSCAPEHVSKVENLPPAGNVPELHATQPSNLSSGFSFCYPLEEQSAERTPKEAKTESKNKEPSSQTETSASNYKQPLNSFSALSSEQSARTLKESKSDENLSSHTEREISASSYNQGDFELIDKIENSIDEPSQFEDSEEHKEIQRDNCDLKTSLLDTLCSPFQCKQCLKVFTQRIQLQMHVCPKSPYKPFQCGHCASSFAHSSELRNHVIVHMSERPFKCGFCGRTFAGATTLNNHVRTHTGERPFVCEYCGRTFAIGTQLSRHIRTPGDCAKFPVTRNQTRGNRVSEDV